MKYFEVTLLSKGRKQTTNIKAQNRADAMSISQNSLGGTVMRIKEIPLPLDVLLEEYKEKFLSKYLEKKLNIKEFVVFLKQIAVMTNAGIPLREALFESMSATEDELIKKIGTSVIEDVDSGLSLTEAFKKFESQVGAITISMIELGEKTGSLAESISRLVDILQEIDENRIKIKKAMRMPMISLGAMAIAFVTLILLVVPKFDAIFKKMGGELPLPTKILLGMEHLFSNYGIIIIIALVAIFFAFKETYRRVYDFRLKIDTFILKTYLLGDITSLGMFSRFMMILSELIKAGIPLNDALESAGITIENSYILEKFKSIPISIQRGTELSEAFEKTELFQNMIISMIKSGESGGELDKMLGEISKYYRNKFQDLIDNLSTLMEPLLMGVIAALVLILALGIFLPMWELSSVAAG